jgi:predicted nucleic acid-binding protein
LILIVLDSSFLIAFYNERDVHHKAALRVMERLLEGEFDPVLLPEYVFLEVVTVLSARRGLSIAVSVGRTLLNSEEVEFVPCSEYFVATMDAFAREGRLGLSFTDAAIVAICRQRGAEYVATFDADFKKVKGLEVVSR